MFKIFIFLIAKTVIFYTANHNSSKYIASGVVEQCECPKNASLTDINTVNIGDIVIVGTGNGEFCGVLKAVD